jgi:hypothetical protein
MGIMGDGVRRVVSLPDGSTCEVSERQYAAIEELKQAISNVALGATQNLVVVQSDGRMVVRSRFFSAAQVGLEDVADALHGAEKLMRKLAASWEGNAPDEARSHLEH